MKVNVDLFLKLTEWCLHTFLSIHVLHPSMCSHVCLISTGMSQLGLFQTNRNSAT